MPAQVERDHAGRAGQIAVYLVQPAQIALRPAVDEQQGRSLRVAPLSGVELAPAAAEDLARGNRNRRYPVQRTIAFHPVSPCIDVPDNRTLGPYDRDGIRACTQLLMRPVAACTQPGQA